MLIGSIVNFLLATQSKNILVKSSLPSLAVIAHGVLFKTFTPYLFYLWPVITLGNFVFIKLFSQTNLLVAAVVKMLILLTGAILLSQLKIIPNVLVNSMGIIQLITAVIGGTAAILWTKTNQK